MVGSSPLLVLAFCAACIFGQVFELAQAQNQTKAVTDPAEGVCLSYTLLHIIVLNSNTKLFVLMLLCNK
jgi:hypothetical protein